MCRSTVHSANTYTHTHTHTPPHTYAHTCTHTHALRSHGFHSFSTFLGILSCGPVTETSSVSFPPRDSPSLYPSSFHFLWALWFCDFMSRLPGKQENVSFFHLSPYLHFSVTSISQFLKTSRLPAQRVSPEVGFSSGSRSLLRLILLKNYQTRTKD